MIKKLRMKFIALSMASLLSVLFLIMGSINVMNYKAIIEDANFVLTVLAENDGKFPKPDERKVMDFKRPMSPEVPYESRYFSVLLDSIGNVIAADTGKIAAVDTAEAVRYAKTVWESGKEQGFLEDYRYIRQNSDFGTRIIFLDCGRNLNTFRYFLLVSFGVSALGLFAVFCLIVLFSGRIIRPVSESYEKQKRFITDAGHEIKTPLTIIDADSEVLAMEIGENEWLQDIQKQVKRLTSLTNDLIYLSKMEEEQKQLQMMEFPISDVIFETSQSFQAVAKMQKKTFISNIKPLLSCYGDEKGIRQLVSILLENALKYSEEGGMIDLTLEKQGRALRLTVLNTSKKQIPKESLDHLFDRFYRTDFSRSSDAGGYGIGLSIAKAIVNAHKGKITASTEDRRSLLVTVTLPG